MQKIIFIAEEISKIGGVEKVSVNLVNEFNKIEKNNIILIVLNSKKENLLNLNENIEVIYLNLDDNIFFYEKIVNITKAFYMFLKLYKVFNKKKIDNNTNVIGMNLGVSRDFFLLLLRCKFNFKMIDTQHGELNYENRIATFFKIQVFKKLDYYIVLNKSMYKDAKNILKLNNVKIIYNFISKKENNNEVIKIGNRALSIGRLSEEKGSDLLIDIWEKVIEKNKNLHLTIVGDGPLMPLIKEKIKKKKLQDNIELIGSALDVEKFYSSSDIFLLTSRTEGFGLVLLEAMQNGLPIVAFDCPTGPRELIVDKENGYLIKCFEIEKYAEKVLEIFEDKEEYIKISNKNKIKSKLFSPTSIIKMWEKILS
ncbi:MAG: glycosyltransferase [Cetobacterium sp.]